MTRKLTIFVLALALPVLAAAVPEETGKPGWRHEQKLERLTRELDLSGEQKSELEAIFEDQRAKHRALREEGRARMKEVLTEEQVAKMDEMRKRRHERWKNRKPCVMD